MTVVFPTGYPEYELMAGGSEVSVDKHNVGDYIKAVVHATLHEGIKAQMQAFRYAALIWSYYLTDVTDWLFHQQSVNCSWH